MFSLLNNLSKLLDHGVAFGRLGPRGGPTYLREEIDIFNLLDLRCVLCVDS
jgi:hypothetical protein